MTPPAPPGLSNRIEGLNVARALAICGMMVVHFMLVMTDGMLDLLDGRPAATFVILAGMGTTLLARKPGNPKAEQNPNGMAAVLRRRGLFLLAVGFLNLTIWEGDILRIYGVSLLLAPWLVGRSSRAVLGAAAGFVLGFMVLLSVSDYGRHWDWTTMTYHGLWTASGLVRNLFYDGFRSVFPWTGLLLFGVWLGRLDWTGSSIPRKAMLWGSVLVLTSPVLSKLLLHWLRTHPVAGLSQEDATACFGLKSMPPLPLFLIHATGVALFVIGACTLAAQRCSENWLVRALAATGRLAFTWYAAHILLGLGGVIVLGWTQTSHWRALATALSFFSLAVIVSVAWTRRFAYGPLESVLRKVGQGAVKEERQFNGRV